ncbi:hypothetical protein CR513_55705, partial [Mucuna pruriens]
MTQFAARAVVEFCTKYGIKQSFTLVEHPQRNRQAEVTNRWLEEAKGRWVEELPQVLWSNHTTPHHTWPPIKSPFHLTFGMDAMIPAEVKESSPRATLCQKDNNKEELRVNLDLLQEEREMATFVSA